MNYINEKQNEEVLYLSHYVFIVESAKLSTKMTLLQFQNSKFHLKIELLLEIFTKKLNDTVHYVFVSIC